MPFTVWAPECYHQPNLPRFWSPGLLGVAGAQQGAGSSAPGAGQPALGQEHSWLTGSNSPVGQQICCLQGQALGSIKTRIEGKLGVGNPRNTIFQKFPPISLLSCCSQAELELVTVLELKDSS